MSFKVESINHVPEPVVSAASAEEELLHASIKAVLEPGWESEQESAHAC